MCEISFLCGELVLCITWITVRSIVCIRKKRFDIKREVLLLLMLVDLGVLLRFTFYPFSPSPEGHVQPLLFDSSQAFPFRVNFVPLVHIMEYDSKRDVLINIVGNIAMFIPTGIILPVLYKRINSYGKIVLSALLISLCIEILQLPFYVRASDIDDLLLNTAGGAIGGLIYLPFLKKQKGNKAP